MQFSLYLIPFLTFNNLFSFEKKLFSFGDHWVSHIYHHENALKCDNTEFFISWLAFAFHLDIHFCLRDFEHFFLFFFSSRETFLVSFTFFRDLHFWLFRFKPWDKFCRKDDGSQNLSQTHYITSRLQLILFSYVSSVYKSKVFIIPVMRLTKRLCLRIYDNYTTLFSILSDYWIIHEVSIGSWNISIALMASSWLLNYFFISISLWGTTHLCQFVLERTKWSFKSYLR